MRRTPMLELVWKFHRALYRATGGRIGGTLGRLPVLLLTVRGRRTGGARAVALNYLTDGDRYVVFGSYAGEDKPPAWWLNLRAAREADVQIGARHVRVAAREAEGDERERLWARVVSADDSYAEYQRRTARRIPVVVLEPARR